MHVTPRLHHGAPPVGSPSPSPDAPHAFLPPAFRRGDRRPRRAAFIAVIVAAVAFVAGPVASATTAQINASSVQQVIRGFGGATVYMPTTPLTSADLDTLFGTGPGQIGFTLLRIRVAPDDAWRAIELSNAQGAHARGAAVIATPWSPPVAMKTNNNQVSGSLKASSYGEYATYLNDFAAYMAANGAPLYAISVQNEPDIVVTYESCDWTAAQMLDFCRNDAGAITATKVIMPESFQFRHGMSDPVLNDTVAAENIDIVGGHIYGGGLAPYPLAASLGKEVWMTEHLDLSTDWAGALATGKEIHDCLATANFSAYIWWYLRRYYGPLGEDSVVTKRGYVMSQFAKFIRPGFHRVDATANPASGVYVSAYKREKLVIVAVNQGTSAATQSFAITGVAVSSVTPWVTSATSNMESRASVPVAAGSFTASLEPQSVTTFVGDIIFSAPTVVVPPQSHTVAEHSTVVLDVVTSGECVSYQWFRNGTPLAGATGRVLTISDIGTADAGSYTVTASNSGGAVTSSSASLTVAMGATPSPLINLSTRSPVGTGDNVQIAGFYIGGSAPKKVLIRAVGPELARSFGMSGVLADPVIELRDNLTQTVVATNDSWDAAAGVASDAVGAFPLSPGSADAALVATLPAGSYSATVTGKGGTQGVALVEVYDADRGSASSLINISTRSFVGAGDDTVQAAGFIIDGATARTVVVRAAGPALHKLFGVTGALANPVIELHSRARPDVVISSDGWDPSLSPHFQKVGAFPWPAESYDAALVATLDPGSYSVVVRGQNNGTGIALVEVYAEP